MSTKALPKAIRVNGHLYRRAASDWRAAATERAIDEIEDMIVGNDKIPDTPSGRTFDVAAQALYTLNALYSGNRKEADELLKSVVQALKYLRRDLQQAGML